jgi:hypothetical protein
VAYAYVPCMMFVVERYLPGVASADLERVLEGLKATARQMRAEGTPIRYLGSTIVPDDESCFCQFEGPSQTTVAEASRRAGIPFARILPVIAIAPECEGETC